MAGLPPDGAYITAHLPPEMRVEGVEIAPPTQVEDIDGVPTSLTRVSVPRPAHIPSGPPRAPMMLQPPIPDDVFPSSRTALQYDFPLLPGVQCRVMFQGEVTADHIQQLADYLAVACKRLGEQERRDASEATMKSKGRKPSSVEKSDEH